MDVPGSGQEHVQALITLAERIEHDSCVAVPVGPMLVELDHLLASFERHAALRATEQADPCARMRRVVDQLRRSVAGGRVQSNSGLTREARRLAEAP